MTGDDDGDGSRDESDKEEAKMVLTHHEMGRLGGRDDADS